MMYLTSLMMMTLMMMTMTQDDVPHVDDDDDANDDDDDDMRSTKMMTMTMTMTMTMMMLTLLMMIKTTMMMSQQPRPQPSRRSPTAQIASILVWSTIRRKIIFTRSRHALDRLHGGNFRCLGDLPPLAQPSQHRHPFDLAERLPRRHLLLCA
jgi:hypothetical protein